jgi:hypothetical protein
VVSLRPLIRFHGLIYTEEAKLFRHSFVLKTAFLRKKMFLKYFKGFRVLIEATKVAFRVSLKPWKPIISNDYLEFISKFEAICETALARESRPRGH